MTTVMTKKILTIAYITLIEFIRNKAFSIMIIFGIAIAGMSAMLPSITPEDKVKLILKMALLLTGIFSSGLIIFFVVLSINNDIEEKTILPLFAKPISRFTYIVGKAIGFIAVTFIMVATLSGPSLIYLKLIHGKALDNTRIVKPVKYIKCRKLMIVGEPPGTGDIFKESGLIGEGASAIWRFQGINRVRFNEEKVKISLKIRGLNVASNSGAAFVGADILDKDDKPLQDTQYAYVGDMNPDTTIVVDKGVVAKNRIIKVRVSPVGKNYYISPKKDDTTFMLKNRHSFYNNYFRSFGIVFFMVSLISVIALSITAIFGQKMSLLLSLFAYITGNTLVYLKSFGSLIGSKSIAEMQSFIPGHGHLHQVETLSKLPKYLTEGLHIAIMKRFFIYFSSIFPDFKRFDPTGYLLYGTYIDNFSLLQIIAYMMTYFAVFLVIAVICFWKRGLVK